MGMGIGGGHWYSKANEVAGLAQSINMCILCLPSPVFSTPRARYEDAANPGIVTKHLEILKLPLSPIYPAINTQSLSLLSVQFFKRGKWGQLTGRKS